MKQYDYVIVGSGITGAVFANLMTGQGKKCLVLEKRPHVGGNCHDKIVQGINVHCYGAHIFHTSDEEVWRYINRFADFNHFINCPIANFKGEIYNLPFNMNTFYQLWGVTMPEQAMQRIEEQRLQLQRESQNLEEQALTMVGKDIYEKLICGYTEKQWGRRCTQLPSFIIRRIPLRFTYDNNYFSDRYQGIPNAGYTAMILRMLEGCEVRTETDFLADTEYYRSIAGKVVYTGMLDAYFNFSEGRLQYRSLRFEDTIYDCDNYQGVAVMNYTDSETPYTRSIEHKHFIFGKQRGTVVTREYPVEWQPSMEPYYPINDDANNNLACKYQDMAKREIGTIFCGRLADYKYYDMDQAIAHAIKKVKMEVSGYN